MRKKTVVLKKREEAKKRRTCRRSGFSIRRRDAKAAQWGCKRGGREKTKSSYNFSFERKLLGVGRGGGQAGLNDVPPWLIYPSHISTKRGKEGIGRSSKEKVGSRVGRISLFSAENRGGKG